MRTGITSDGEDGAAPTAASPSQVIPFRRAPPQLGSAAGDEPSSSPAIPLGDAVQAVVMRLANKRIRLRVAGPGREEDDRDQR
ncbi:hypothetical protein CN155_04770 [Sinorhizobium meliloti]|nr:hypothetical protein [Sinorhizobium meliloti]RVK60576.1 hypothetical protein CN155_04770 [Sinorhizobium meliloti]